MSTSTITPVEIAPETFNRLWGVKVMNYTQDGYDLDFEMVMVNYSLQRATVIEAEIPPVSTVVTNRNKMLERLGNALADLTDAQKQFPSDVKDETKDLKVSLKSADTAKIVNSIADSTVITNNEVTRSSCERSIQLVKTKMDRLNNDSQSDMTRLQSIVDKRNQTLDAASTLMSGVSDSRGTCIKNMG